VRQSRSPWLCPGGSRPRVADDRVPAQERRPVSVAAVAAAAGPTSNTPQMARPAALLGFPLVFASRIYAGLTVQPNWGWARWRLEVPPRGRRPACPRHGGSTPTFFNESGRVNMVRSRLRAASCEDVLRASPDFTNTGRPSSPGHRSLAYPVFLLGGRAFIVLTSGHLSCPSSCRSSRGWSMQGSSVAYGRRGPVSRLVFANRGSCPIIIL